MAKKTLKDFVGIISYVKGEAMLKFLEEHRKHEMKFLEEKIRRLRTNSTTE